MRKAGGFVVARTAALVLGALLGSVLALGGSAPAQAYDEDSISALVNQARWDAGLSGLNRNAAMDAVALGWARQLAANGTLSHNPNYSSQIPAGWTGAAENVAQGYPTAQAVHNGWMNSPGHRANVLGGYTDIGIALLDAGGSTWAVEVFGAYPGSVGPAAPAPVVPAPVVPAPTAPAPGPSAAGPPAAVPAQTPAPAGEGAVSTPSPVIAPPSSPTVSPSPDPASAAPAEPSSESATAGASALARQAPNVDRAGAEGDASGGAILGVLLLALALAVLLAGAAALLLPGSRGSLQRWGRRIAPSRERANRPVDQA